MKQTVFTFTYLTDDDDEITFESYSLQAVKKFAELIKKNYKPKNCEGHYDSYLIDLTN